ncbi:MAG: PD-(D/E)XK nuclease family protein [Alphaproteobacteria bacterium]|nr:PD-(D/E)XK nuclease family protein [Alphaproteobacteria bacterium]
MYAAGRLCLAKAAWLAHGDRSAIPDHPRALLGTAVHHVIEKAGAGRLAGSTAEERLAHARREFDTKIEELFSAAHPMLPAKFGSAERLPYYNLYKERAASIAADVAEVTHMPSGRAGSGSGRSAGRLVERGLEAEGGRLYGRIDALDPKDNAVVDYKTSRSPQEGGVRDGEARQLRVYAYLAQKNGFVINKGVIIRSDRSRGEIEISPDEAEDEARAAISTLDRLNERSGEEFASAATPSPEACAFCPCLPACPRFWDEADSSWAAETGVHLEGTVAELREAGTGIVGLDITVERGSAKRGAAHVERLTTAWLQARGGKLPTPGSRVRIVSVRAPSEDSENPVYRAHRESTSVWEVDNG